MTPAEPGAGVLAVIVGARHVGSDAPLHVALDLACAERTVVDADLVDRAVEVLAPDALPPIRSGEFDVAIEPDDGSCADLGAVE